jgi:hypothetical protein
MAMLFKKPDADEVIGRAIELDLGNLVWNEPEQAELEARTNGLVSPTPPNPRDAEARRAYHVAEIKAYLAGRRPLAEVLEAAELASAEDRPYLILRSLLNNTALYQRAHSGERIDLAVQVVDRIFSDNSDGCSTASAQRVAALLGCDERSVRRARERNANAGLTRWNHRPGLADQHWPAIDRNLVGQNTSTVWWLDATSEPPAPRGRPRKERTPDCPTFSQDRTEKERAAECPDFSDKDRTASCPTFSHFPEKERTLETKRADTQVSDELTIELTKRDTNPSPAVAGDGRASVALQFEEFWRAFPPGRKRDKGDARDLFCAIVTGKFKKRHASAATLIEAAKRYAATNPDPDYVPMPTTWLNGGRWEDDLDEKATAAATNGSKRPPFWWKSDALRRNHLR